MKLPFLPLLLTTLFAGLACPGPAQEKVTADAIIKSTGIDSGLALVIADDAALACDLADGGTLLVHLLAGRAESIGTLRAEVRSRGLGGRVVVQALAADGHLPHPDRFVNPVVTALDQPGDGESASAGEAAERGLPPPASRARTPERCKMAQAARTRQAACRAALRAMSDRRLRSDFPDRLLSIRMRA